ncbi:hypothetical protein KC19_2G042200 [Ceratodon purpureus]|uniref:Core domain-containing protein n=1 Tax=Ceratodon purpureus TaxID=3225 RepID=A0A8T0IRP8_CERPU|nr:hypothetical protein KC19_2G042200 [Ceratodon purpureus]
MQVIVQRTTSCGIRHCARGSPLSQAQTSSPNSPVAAPGSDSGCVQVLIDLGAGRLRFRVKLFCGLEGVEMAAFAQTMATTWASRTCARVVPSRVASCGVTAVPSVSVAVRSTLKRSSFVVRAADSATASPSGTAPAIVLTEKALSHLNKLRASQGKELCLRVGVRQGGCSGMSYVMDFEETSNLRPDDSVIDYEGFKMVCDPKSLLFLYGMQLDYSDALIGGGFAFSNPNASSTCGCGKSFAA